jgi:phospholipid/cholesterol/gamma-HCH transport system substrate-binding protein
MDRKRIIKIGIVVSLAIFIFFWGINFLKHKDLFKKETTYFGIYQNINGIGVSAAVFLNGFQIGQVSDVYFNNDKAHNLVVEMMIESKYKIPKNSTAQIYSTDVLGTKGIQILLNDSVQDFHDDGDTLLTSIEGDLKTQISAQMLPFKSKIEAMVSSMDTVLTSVSLIFNSKTRENLSKSFASIRITLQNFEGTSYTLDTLMQTEKNTLKAILANAESITQNLKNNNDKIQNIISNFSEISDTLAKANFAGVIQNADKAINDLSKIVDKINAGEGSLGQLVNNDTLYTNLENASYNLNRLLRDLKENPKRYVRFSAFDLGRTVIVDDEKGKKYQKKEEEN